MRQFVLDIPIDNLSIDEIVQKVIEGQRIFQVFVNIHKIVLFYQDLRLLPILKDKRSIFSIDGRWVEFFVYFKGLIPKQRFGGLDVIESFFSSEGDFKFYLLGADEETLNKVVQNLKIRFGKKKIVGYRHGFFKNDNDVIKDINDAQAEVLFIALPSPKKEILGYEIFNRVNSLRYVAGVGGAFDIIANKFKRAPKHVQFLGMEWLWRSCFNRRLLKRYFFDFFTLLKIVAFRKKLPEYPVKNLQ